MSEHLIFTTGGTVQAGPGIYLPRPADDELLAHCQAGDFSYVLTARQMGKSSLMVRTAERLKAIGMRTAIIDLSSLGTKLESEQWYLGLVDELVEQLNLDVDYRAWWQKHAQLGNTQRLSRFLREVALEAAETPLVVFIDEIDTTLSLSFADDFFAAIRSYYNARSTDPVYKRLAFVLLGVATPGDLIRDPLLTPFNIGQRIDLTDFTLDQALPLAEGLNLPPEQARRTLQLVLDWTGGHPYLTQSLCKTLAKRNRTDWNEATVAQVVNEIFLGENSKPDQNLQFVRDMLIKKAPNQNVKEVLTIFQTIRSGKKVLDDEQSIYKSHLKISGVIRIQNNRLVLRNRIYEKTFTLEWVEENLPSFTYTVGGIVRNGNNFYLSRPADDELLIHCQAEDFSYVLAARQMGKSSLIAHTTEHLKATGTRTAIIDLTSLGTYLQAERWSSQGSLTARIKHGIKTFYREVRGNFYRFPRALGGEKLDFENTLQAEQWYFDLMDELVKQLNLKMDYRAWWQKQAQLGTTSQRLSRFLREVVFETPETPLVVFIDGIDTTRSLRFLDDFFAAILACYEARCTDPAYKHLTFVIMGVATPDELIPNPIRSLFKISHQINLTDFTLEQVLPMANGLGLPMERAHQTLEWVLDWTGGHPYLTQLLCQVLADSKGSEITAKTVDRLVESTFLGERSLQDRNLFLVHNMLTRHVPKPYISAVWQNLRDIERGLKVLDDEQSVPKKYLKLAGIVRREGDALVLRNKIYARAFSQTWLAQNWPVSWRQRTLRLLAFALLLIFIAIYGTFAVLNYGNDLRWQYAVWQAGKLSQSPVTPFLDTSGAKMITIPAGTFSMGSENGQSDESPVHQVYLDEFSIDVYEVTNRQYRECVKARFCQPPLSDRSYNRFLYYNDLFFENFPVINVNWNMAQAFCKWRGARLPSEAEWEYAARGGLEGKTYPWGDAAPVCTPIAANGTNFGHCSLGDTMKVGTFAPNGYGLYDMAGNVWEWTADWYAADYYATLGQNAANPLGPANGDTRVVRGSSWGDDNAYYLRVSYRHKDIPGSANTYYGFRCAGSVASP